MKNVTFAAWLCCCLLIPAGTDSLDAGEVEITNCNKGFIDIREKANNTIKCKGFNESDTIVWAFQRNDENIPNVVATCYASFGCILHRPDYFAVERSPSHSTLFYHQYDCEVDKDATVACRSQFQGSSRSRSCKLNVINPAELSSCAVEEDRDRGTVRGSCRFEHAYSDSRAFSCTWFRGTDGKLPELFSGHITYDIGSHGSSGRCSFNSTDTDWNAGTYTYTISFYPGPGNITVNIGSLETHTQKPTRSRTPVSSSPVFSPATDNVDPTSSPDVSLPTTKDSVDSTSHKTQEENDLPMGAIVGGIVAVVAVVFIVVVVVVVVFVRKKGKQKAAGSAHGSSNDNAADYDDFEEHVAPINSTTVGPYALQEIDVLAATPLLQISARKNTYEKPARRPSNAEPEHVYNVSNKATTTSTTTTTPSKFMETTPGNLHNTITNQHREQGKTLDTVHLNPVYVNENQPGEESSGLQHPTYVNDHPQAAQGYVDANRDSNPYYSEIRDTGID